LFYDPMLAKLIVWAPTREAAIARMHRALLELTIDGIDSSRDFHLRVMEDEEFRRGDIEIQWLERRLASLTASEPPAGGATIAAIAAALIAESDRSHRGVASGGVGARAVAPTLDPRDGWRDTARREGLR
jgi:acetyl-CoA carboxylase biotin carboxylase subunit